MQLKDMNDHPEFPTNQETLKFIELLEGEEWKEFDGQNLDQYLMNTHKQITNICNLFTSFYLNSPEGNPFGFRLFRVRKYTDIKNRHLRCEYAYPPAYLTKSNLRANLIGHPVFYASESPIVALLEYIQQWDSPDVYSKEEYVISCWELRKDMTYLIAALVPEWPEISNLYSGMGRFTNEKFRKDLKMDIDDDRIDGFRNMLKYFSSLFLKDDKRVISSYIGHHYLYKVPFGNCILIYPSVKSRYGRNNFALHPNFVDEFLTLSHIYRVRINSIDNVGTEGVNVSLSIGPDLGFTEKSKIFWKPIKALGDSFKELYKSDFES